METIYVRTLRNGKQKFYSKTTEELSEPLRRDGHWFLRKRIGQGYEDVPVTLEPITWMEILNLRKRVEYDIRVGIAGSGSINPDEMLHEPQLQ
jgi:hypothetical protein